jgi:signal transduction histidine kinase
MKIQTKTTILFTILTATIFLILNVTVYFFINEYAHRDFNKRLELRAKISAQFRFEKDEFSNQAFNDIQRKYLEKLPEEQAFILKIDSATGKIIGEVPKALPAKYLKEIQEGNGNTVYYQNRYRHFAGFMYQGHHKGSYIVIKSATNEYSSEMMQWLRIIKIIQFICAVILIYTVGLYFSRKTFQPIRDIISNAKMISGGNLHLRLKEQEGSDELAELTATFNQMLGKLETAFDAQNNFISNASHELRTPLTAIIGEADYALSKERSAADYKQSLEEIAHHAEKLQQVTKGLLALAQTGFTNSAGSWKKIRLDQLLYDVKETCDTIIPNNQVFVDIPSLPADEELISLNGNYELMKMAVNNIVINACKYSGNKPVSLQLRTEGNQASIIIRDEGIGIPEEELKHIYEPFYRASNSKSFHGHGIGLPLANNIIRLHKGRIVVNSTVGHGTDVTIQLPVEAPALTLS